MFGHRSPSWKFLHLDRRDNVLGELQGVTGGSCEIVSQSPLGGSATLELDHVAGQSIDWLNDRMQAIYDPGVDGFDGWPVGTYMFTSPSDTHPDSVVSYSVGMLTKLSVLDRVRTPSRVSYPAGTPIIETVVSLIQSTGESRISATPSALVLPNGRSFDPGTTLLAIINELLATAGYWSLWCDGFGQYRVEPYVNPEKRPVSHHFRYGEDSLYFDGWKHTRNLSDIPNVTIAIGQGSADEFPIVGFARNVNPDSPYSVPNRGEIAAPPYEGQDFATVAEATLYAEMRLRDLMDPVARFEITHAMLPIIQNDLVAFTPEDGVRRLATVQRMNMNFTDDTDLGAEWREVIPI